MDDTTSRPRILRSTADNNSAELGVGDAYRILSLEPELDAAAFDPQRLRLARQRNGYTRADLAAAVSVSPAAIGQFESRKARPSSATLQALAEKLGVPAAYFAAGRPLLEASPEATFFRSLRSTRVGERHQALAIIAHLAEITRVLSKAVQLPKPLAPSALTPGLDDPARAAGDIRFEWGLGDGPVTHLVARLEQHGVVVSVSRFHAASRIDGFSCWVGGRPFVCLSKDRGDVLRRRFSAAHELGHLLLHTNGQAAHGDCEREADSFAAELLMPAAIMADVLPSRLDLAGLYQLQAQWSVSASALLRRSRELGVLDERTYRAGCVLLAKSRSPLTAESPQLPGEWPRLLSSALDLASGPLGLTLEALANGLRLPVAEVTELLGHLTDERPRLELVLDERLEG